MEVDYLQACRFLIVLNVEDHDEQFIDLTSHFPCQLKTSKHHFILHLISPHQPTHHLLLQLFHRTNQTAPPVLCALQSVEERNLVMDPIHPVEDRNPIVHDEKEKE